MSNGVFHANSNFLSNVQIFLCVKNVIKNCQSCHKSGNEMKLDRPLLSVFGKKVPRNRTVVQSEKRCSVGRKKISVEVFVRKSVFPSG